MYCIKTSFAKQDMFTKTGFNHVGDKYVGNTQTLDKRFKGKQMNVGTVNVRQLNLSALGARSFCITERARSFCITERARLFYIWRGRC